MAVTFTEWKPLGHEPIVKLAENLWWVRGDLPGMSLKRVMTAIRLDDGKIAVHSAIAHRLEAPAYKKRYPNLRVFTLRGARDKVAEVVPVDGTYEDFSGTPSLRLETLPGVREAEGVLFIRSADGTSVVLNDVMFDRVKGFPALARARARAFGSRELIELGAQGEAPPPRCGTRSNPRVTDRSTSRRRPAWSCPLRAAGRHSSPGPIAPSS